VKYSNFAFSDDVLQRFDEVQEDVLFLCRLLALLGFLRGGVDAESVEDDLE
jgi:hypothetical protein